MVKSKSMSKSKSKSSSLNKKSSYNTDFFIKKDDVIELSEEKNISTEHAADLLLTSFKIKKEVGVDIDAETIATFERDMGVKIDYSTLNVSVVYAAFEENWNDIANHDFDVLKPIGVNLVWDKYMKEIDIIDENYEKEYEMTNILSNIDEYMNAYGFDRLFDSDKERLLTIPSETDRRTLALDLADHELDEINDKKDKEALLNLADEWGIDVDKDRPFGVIMDKVSNELPEIFENSLTNNPYEFLVNEIEYFSSIEEMLDTTGVIKDMIEIDPVYYAELIYEENNANGTSFSSGYDGVIYSASGFYGYIKNK